MRPRITFCLRDTLDRRTPEQLRRYDAILERLYRVRVAANPKERRRVERECESAQLPSLLRRQAG